jgi:hypothetical protein
MFIIDVLLDTRRFVLIWKLSHLVGSMREIFNFKVLVGKQLKEETLNKMTVYQ